MVRSASATKVYPGFSGYVRASILIDDGLETSSCRSNSPWSVLTRKCPQMTTSEVWRDQPRRGEVSREVTSVEP